MRLCSFLTAALLALAPLTAALRSNLTQLQRRDQIVPRVGGAKMVRGVNLGSWFVLEPWMIPHVFTPALRAKGAVDQWTYMTAFNDNNAALAALQQHWSTWIVEDDFKQIAEAGLNTVRLPIPHWLWKSAGSEKEPFLVGAELPYIDQALRWASQYGLEVMLDMHTAPGSQNGWDHSGRLGPINLPKNPQNSDRLIFALEECIKRWVNDPSFNNVVTSFEILNEPASFKAGMPKSFFLPLYKRAFDAVRAAVSPTAGVMPTIVMHDAFASLSSWDKDFADKKQWPTGSFAQSTHRYQKFGDSFASFSFDRHIQYMCAQGRELAAAQATRAIVMSEWHLGIWCRGSCQYSTMQESINSMNNASQNLFYRRFWEAQVNTIERNMGGWLFWNWKTVSAAHASYKDGMVQGWIPKLATDRAYKVDASGCPTKELIKPLTFATQSNPPTPVVAPNGYRISWVIDGKRSSFAASTGYISRFTVGTTWTGNDQASACAARCEQTNGCAMAELIRYNGGAEGQSVCALYKSYQASSTATFATGPNNGVTVVKSYAIRRNAGAVAKRGSP